MSGLIRFGVSLEKELLSKFDQRLKEKGYTNRSEAIRGLIREDLIKKEWQEAKATTGAIILVYDHHKRDLAARLTDAQHQYHDNIISSQHIHLDHDNCLEILVVKGKPKEIEKLFGKLQSTRGLKHAGFSLATTGKELV